MIQSLCIWLLNFHFSVSHTNKTHHHHPPRLTTNSQLEGDNQRCESMKTPQNKQTNKKIHHNTWLSDVDVKGKLIKNAEETQINDNHQVK